MCAKIVNSWTLRDIVAVSITPHLNSDAAIKLIGQTEDFERFQVSPIADTVSSFYTENHIFDDKEKDIIAEADRITKCCEENGYQIVTFWSDNYPALLKHIQYPPIVLYVWGELQASDSPAIAIVGTRRCTSYGKMCTEHFAEVFAKAGIIVVSGLATGIDTYSHLNTIKNGGVTYAVIASGLDKISPQTSLANAEKIIESGGAIITTHRPGVSAIPPFFLQRNRIISGISKAVLVVESAFKGGSLNTARNAQEQNREVYAVPGNINAERSKGTNKLISRNVAAIALSPEDILKDLRLGNETTLFSDTAKQALSLTATQAKLLEYIDSEPIGVDKIAELTGLNIQTILAELLTLELLEVIRQLPGNNFVRFDM